MKWAPRLSVSRLVLLLVALWAGGFLLFVRDIQSLAEPPINGALPPTQGIVVLTGGSERLATGLALLVAGKGEKLFVSGVHPGLTLDHILPRTEIPAALRMCCIRIGHAAEDTRGNAEETAVWMEIEGYGSLRLVTSHYHMRRSLLAFRTEMPRLTILPYPVVAGSLQLDAWWAHPGTASLLATEYNKYLLALLRFFLRSSP